VSEPTGLKKADRGKYALHVVVAAALSFALTLALLPIIIGVLRRLDAYDVPSERSSHHERTLRGGGVAVAIGAIAGVTLGGWDDATSLTTLLVAVTILALVGLADDLRTLEVFPRLGAQLLGALLCLPWLLRNLSMPWGARLVLAVAAVIWVMGFVNSFNFMDGINGISALYTAVAGAAFVVVGTTQDLPLVSLSGAVVGAAAVAFLPFNFPRAMVFLGDSGSYFLGGWIAFTILAMLVSEVPPEAAFAPALIYLADTSVTLGRRIRRGANWWESHHEHVYQQLIDRGWTHVSTAFLVAAFSAVCVLLSFVSLTPSLIARGLADLAIAAVVVTYLLLPTMLSRHGRPSRAGRGTRASSGLSVPDPTT
jgi:UDP-GlcNAc:undecaprenyl-phosphate/decaprenyl-phosphate GlcNAc-1-phosphate transferase